MGLFDLFKNRSATWSDFLTFVLDNIDPNEPVNFQLNCLMGKTDEQRRSYPGAFTLEFDDPPYNERFRWFDITINELIEPTANVLYGQDLINFLDMLVNEYEQVDATITIQWHWKRDPQYTDDVLRCDDVTFYMDETEPNLITFEGHFARLDKNPFLTGGCV